MNNQLTSMYAWSSIGTSNYHALQANLRKQISHGVQFDLNYTFSKSIDISSAAARLGFSSNNKIGPPGSRLVNAFDPRGARGVSDFDMTDQINANWIIELPIGAGKLVGRNASHGLDALIGGWHLSGLARWTTGLPFTVGNWAVLAYRLVGTGQCANARPKTGAFKQPDGTLSVFADPAAALNDFAHPFPGQSGSLEPCACKTVLALLCRVHPEYRADTAKRITRIARFATFSSACPLGFRASIRSSHSVQGSITAPDCKRVSLIPGDERLFHTQFR